MQARLCSRTKNKIKITTDTEKTRGEINKKAEALGSLAWNKMMSDQNLEAIEDYTKAISLSPNNRDNRSWFACRAEAFMKSGNYENLNDYKLEESIGWKLSIIKKINR